MHIEVKGNVFVNDKIIKTSQNEKSYFLCSFEISRQKYNYHKDFLPQTKKVWIYKAKIDTQAKNL